jgi:hypothetical protein
MARLQAAFATSADFRLVSITVDPEHDTPDVLSRSTPPTLGQMRSAGSSSPARNRPSIDSCRRLPCRRGQSS